MGKTLLEMLNVKERDERWGLIKWKKGESESLK